MTDHKFDFTFPHGRVKADIYLDRDIDELIAQSSLGSDRALAVRYKVAPGRANRIVCELTPEQPNGEQAHDGTELDEMPLADRA
ncbi:hypothetical protein ACFXPS_25085 [Nocardia sp. NPDC059091]|uniref:hypothetical protein n=1 Tax=unclassified Nocardia TaxID=2637762 RepID=UPI00368B1E76